MEKIIKIQSDNSVVQTFNITPGNTTAPSQQLLDFRIPETGAVYDLSKSYVAINMGLSCPAEALIAGSPVAQPDLTPVRRLGMGVITDTNGIEESHLGSNALLVKNVQVYSQKKGMITSRRRNDTLSLIKRNLEKDDISLQSDLDLLGATTQAKGAEMSTSYYLTEVRNCPGADLATCDGIADDGTGENRSRAINRDHKIHLKDLTGIGHAPLYSTSVFGETQLHLEMNFDKLAGKILTATAGVREPAGEFLACDDQAGVAAAPVLDYTLTKVYQDPEFRSPIYVGQGIRISGTGSASGAKADVAGVIKRISYSGATGKLSFSVNTDLMGGAGAQNGENITGITIKTQLAANPVIACQVNGAELHLVEVKNPSNVPSQIDYLDYSTQEITAPNNRTTLNHQTKLEPNAQTLYIAQTEPSSIAPDVKQVSYRLQIDGEDISGNRDIKMFQPLHRDRLIRAYRNKNVPLENLSGELIRTANTEINMRSDRMSVAVEPLVLKDNEKNLQMEINNLAGNNIADVLLYKELVKTI
jgi:hypothetical protein